MKEDLSYCLYYIMVIFLSGFSNYFLDYLNVDYIHGSAVFSSVYNVMHGAPYEEINNSIYGNYALFLAIPTKILGGNYFDLGRIMSLISMICIALAIYTIHNMIERKEIRILCVAALLWVDIFRRTNYWQLYPMRILCPILLISWLIFLNKRGSDYKYVCYAVTYIILTFSILWNKESGFVCLVGYLFYSFSRGISLRLGRKKIYEILLESFIMITSIFTAFIMVGLYNLLVSGKWISVQIFFFPLFSERFMIDTLRIGLEKGIWPWMAVAILFMGVAGRFGLKILRKEEIDPKDYIYASVAVMGLGLMTYFINRPAYMNLTICYYEAVICIGGIACSIGYKDYGFIVTTFMRTLSMMILVALVVGETVQLGTSLYKEKGLDRQKILGLRNEIWEDAETDTYAFGICIPELYSLLGWKTRSYTTEWVDMFITRDAVLEKLYDDLEIEDSIITDKQTLMRNEDVAEYVYNLFYVDKVYVYDDRIEFYLMKRRQ